jgi:hypothetical protein
VGAQRAVKEARRGPLAAVHYGVTLERGSTSALVGQQHGAAVALIVSAESGDAERGEGGSVGAGAGASA